MYGSALPITFFTGRRVGMLRNNGLTYRASASVSQNIYHYGRFSPDRADEPESSFRGLMAGVWARPLGNEGLRVFVGPLDAAVLGDLGLHLAPDPH